MDEKQIELLRKALTLYHEAILLTKEYESDYEQENEFYHMVVALSEKIGAELNYE